MSDILKFRNTDKSKKSAPYLKKISPFRFASLYVMADKVVTMTIRYAEYKRWAVGRLVIIRYPLTDERLTGLLITRSRYASPSVELMTGRSNYVFRVDSK